MGNFPDAALIFSQEIEPVLASKIQISKRTTVKLVAHAWSTKCRRNKKLIAQFAWKLRNERFKYN
jgi:hypothetical protein